MSQAETCPEKSEGSSPIGPFIQREGMDPSPEKLPTIDDLMKIGRGRQRLTPIEYYQASNLIQQNRRLGFEIGLKPLEIEVAEEYFPRFVGTGRMVAEVLKEIADQTFLERGLDERKLSTLLMRYRRTVKAAIIPPPTIESSADPNLPKEKSKHLDPLPLPYWYEGWIKNLTKGVPSSITNQILEDTNWIMQNSKKLKEQSLEENDEEDDETMLFWSQ